MRDDRDRLQDILDAVAAIRSRCGRDRTPFDGDELLRVWCLHHLQVIGEAASGLSEDLRQRHAEVPWREIVGMRNVIVHGYFQVDWDEVWVAVDRDVDPLAEAVRRILDPDGDAPDRA